MTEPEYKAFQQWIKDMRAATDRGLELAKEKFSAQIITLNQFDIYVSALRQATEREERKPSEHLAKQLRETGNENT